MCYSKFEDFFCNFRAISVAGYTGKSLNEFLVGKLGFLELVRIVNISFLVHCKKYDTFKKSFQIHNT